MLCFYVGGKCVCDCVLVFVVFATVGSGILWFVCGCGADLSAFLLVCFSGVGGVCW